MVDSHLNSTKCKEPIPCRNKTFLFQAVHFKAELYEVHGDSAPTSKTIYLQINKFKRGRGFTKRLLGTELRSLRTILLTKYMVSKRTIAMRLLRL